MNDFNLTDYCDLARGVAAPDAEREMREALAADADAARAVELFSRVAAVAEHDRHLAIPDYALRVAKAIGSLRRHDDATSHQGSWLRRLAATVTFDSWLQPASAGTRDMQASHRQILFSADRFTVDLRLENEAALRRNVSGDLVGASTVVVGQILERDPAGADREATVTPAVDVPVLVLAEGRVVEHCRTSRFGEFQAAGLPQRGLSLCFLVGKEECLDIPLGMTQDW